MNSGVRPLAALSLGLAAVLTWGDPGVAAPQQGGTLRIADVLTRGLPARASATLTPAVPGRAVDLQMRKDGTWRTVATDHESRAGWVSWRTTTFLKGAQRFRLRAAPTRTLPAYVSEVEPVQVATLRRLSSDGDQAFAPTISDDGGAVAWVAGSPTGAHNSDIRLWRRSTGTVDVVTTGDADSFSPALSGDGTELFFDSLADNLDGANPFGQVYVHPVGGMGVSRVTDGNQWSLFGRPTDDGSQIVFLSFATDLVPGPQQGPQQVFLLDRGSGDYTRITNGNGQSDQPAIAGDGSRVVLSSSATDLLPPDPNFHYDIYLWSGGTLTRSATGNGDSSLPTISDDGATFAFDSFASDLVAGDRNDSFDVFVVRNGQTSRASAGMARATSPALSGDGSLLAFSGATKADDAVVVLKTLGGTTTYAPLLTDSGDPQVSETGRFVAFVSFDRLVPADTNTVADVYLWDRGF